MLNKPLNMFQQVFSQDFFILQLFSCQWQLLSEAVICIFRSHLPLNGNCTHNQRDTKTTSLLQTWHNTIHNVTLCIVKNSLHWQQIFAWRAVMCSDNITHKKINSWHSALPVCFQESASFVWPLWLGQEASFTSKIVFGNIKETRKHSTLKKQPFFYDWIFVNRSWKKEKKSLCPKSTCNFLGFGMQNLLMFPTSFSPGRAATDINSVAAAEAKPWAAFKSQTGQCSHILSALQRLLASS